MPSTSACALDNTGNNLSPPPRKREGCGRKYRVILRSVAANLLPDEAVARCGRHPVGDFAKGVPPGYVAIRSNGEVAGFVGVVTCGSVWVCPDCAAKIAAERRREVRRLLLAHRDAGGAVYMATFTMPHHAHQCPRELRRAVSKAFTALLTGKARAREWGRAGVLGYVRALEVTHGANGWHPHLHVLWVLRDCNPFAAAAFGKWLFRRWSATIERAGFGVCSPGAWRFEEVRTVAEAGEYVVKGAADWELTHAHLKDGRDGNRGPMQILADVERFGLCGDVLLFQRYAAAFKGARQLTWSVGLRERYEVCELTDQEAAAREVLEMRTVALLSVRGFEKVVVRGLLVELLEVAAAGSFAAVAAFLAAHGIGMMYLMPPPDG